MPRWARIVIGSGLALALLLAGAAIGLLIAASRGPGVPAADSVDVGFAQDMTVHHAQAVAMATWERDHTADPVLRQLAFDIETGQIAQVGRMQGWLALWQAPTLPTGGHMAWMRDVPGHSDHGAGVERMPGMATEEELASLRASTGAALDVRFLQLMLRHHEGGVEMARYARGACRRAGGPRARRADTRRPDRRERLHAHPARRARSPAAAGVTGVLAGRRRVWRALV